MWLAGKDGPEVFVSMKWLRCVKLDKRCLPISRNLWWRERDSRWQRVREKRAGDERRVARRRLWRWKSAEMEAMRSESWEGVRVESASMKTE